MKLIPSKAAGVAGALALGAALALAATAGPAVARTHPVPSQMRPAAIGRGLGGSLRADSVQTAQVCAKAAAKAGYSFNNFIRTNNGGSYPIIVVAVAVGLAESSCNPSAQGVNGPTSGCPNGSVDRGLWQINNCFWPQVSNACAFQAQCNADAAFSLIGNKGFNWCPWNTYALNGNCNVAGPYTQFLGLAQQAVTSAFTFQLESHGDGTCLDADSTSVGNGGKIFQWTCNASDRYQQWQVTDIFGHLPLLKNVGTGTCLDADGTNSGNGAPIFQWGCNSSDSHQQWWFYGSGQLNTNGNADAGVHSQGNGTCLDADGTSKGNGAPIFQWACNQNDISQQWN